MSVVVKVEMKVPAKQVPGFVETMIPEPLRQLLLRGWNEKLPLPGLPGQKHLWELHHESGDPPEAVVTLYIEGGTAMEYNPIIVRAHSAGASYIAVTPYG